MTPRSFRQTVVRVSQSIATTNANARIANQMRSNMLTFALLHAGAKRLAELGTGMNGGIIEATEQCSSTRR